jgi:hypothetical protein
MTETFRCENHAALVSFLYDDFEPGERETMMAHLASCASCTAELALLRATRRQLAGWSAPERALGFQISESQVAGPRLQDSGPLKPADVAMPAPAVAAAPWWRQPLPAWAQMAAAVVIFGSGLAVGMTNGRSTPAPAAVAAVAVQPVRVSPVSAPVASVSPADLKALESRLHAEISAEVSRVRTAVPARADEAMLRRVDTLITQRITQSEQRQRQDLALRTAQLVRDFDAQRRVDLVNIQNSMGAMEALSGAQARDIRTLNLMRINSQR